MALRMDIIVVKADSKSFSFANCPCKERSFSRKDIGISPIGEEVHVLVELIEKPFRPMIDTAFCIQLR